MYTLTDSSVLLDDGTCIPIDPGNKEYQIFLAWQLAGNAPLIFNPIPAGIVNENATFKTIRDSLISQLAGIAIAANAAGDLVTFNGAITARQSIIDIINQPAVVAATTPAALRSAIAGERLRIIQAMPVSLKQILNKLN